MAETESAPTVIDLLRHAECEGGTIFRGSWDVPLSEPGWDRLRRVADRQPGWQRIYTSPLTRCRLFAEELAGARGLPLAEDERLREMSFGDWEGRPLAEVWQAEAKTANRWFADPGATAPPNGEPYAEVQRRARAVFEAVAAAAPGEHSLLVTHGAWIRILLCDLLGMPSARMNRWDVPYGCLTRLEISSGPLGELCRLVAHNIGEPA